MARGCALAALLVACILGAVNAGASGQRACVEGVPGPIRKLKARARGQTEIVYEWLPPRGDRRLGEACVDSYERTVVEAGGVPTAQDTTTSALDPTGREGEFTETRANLKPATSYRITVRAVNAQFGPGPAFTVPVRTRGTHDDSHPPGPVLDFDISQAGTSLVVTWLPPAAGGFATSYEVLVTDPNGRRILDTTTDKPKVVITSGLRAGTRYTIQIAAVNDAGRGPASRTYYTTAEAAAASAPAAAGATAAVQQVAQV